MDKEQKKLLLGEIKEVKKQNFEELYLYTKDSIYTYFLALINYGPFHPITKSVMIIWKEFFYILKKENRIMKFIDNNYKKIELSEVYLFLDELDDVNEETYLYYSDILNGIKDASELKQPSRCTRPRKDFNTLLETEDYNIKCYGLILEFEDIKKFLNYPSEFWNYIESRIRIISRYSDKQMNPEVLMKFDNNDCLLDMRVIVPEIIDLYTALINVHEFKHAYDLFMSLGNVIKDECEYELQAQKKEEEFKKEYILKLVK